MLDAHALCFTAPSMPLLGDDCSHIIYYPFSLSLLSESQTILTCHWYLGYNLSDAYKRGV